MSLCMPAVAFAGVCIFVLNGWIFETEKTLCETSSSFLNSTTSPTFTRSSVTEKLLPFWVTTCFSPADTTRDTESAESVRTERASKVRARADMIRSLVFMSGVG